jgi:hypothetical protein
MTPKPSNAIDVSKLFYDGLWEADHFKRLTHIGDELNKVRMYANEVMVNDIFSQTVVFLTLSSYFAGLVPIMRLESALFVEKEFRNEYAYALAVRAYIEVAGRLHKGMRLWRQYRAKNKSLEELREGVDRLLAKFQPSPGSPGGIFQGNGFNVMTLVGSLKDKIPNIVETYGNLSGYVHGGFEEQMFLRKASWLSEQRQDSNPVVASNELVALKLRAICFEDFDELLSITMPLRERYDLKQSSNS